MKFEWSIIACHFVTSLLGGRRALPKVTKIGVSKRKVTNSSKKVTITVKEGEGGRLKGDQKLWGKGDSAYLVSQK